MRQQTLQLTLGGILCIAGWGFSQPAIAQNITPATDGTGTTVNQVGDRFEIQGGSHARDGQNQFHSFTQFGLDAHQTADFLTQPHVQNILGRVVGGAPSQIDGLVQVSGSAANLYLMNPAGIVFGAGASLNVGGDFTATTASGIGFGAGQWFNATGDNDYTNLVGNPASFAFDVGDAGAIVNGGNLSTPGNLTLLAGEVLNTGTLAANTVTLQAVPDSALVRLSQPNHLLSLEILPPRDARGNGGAIAPLDLPALLTGSNTGLSTTVQGEVQFSSGEVVAIAPGTTVAAGAIAASEVNLLGEQVALLEMINTPAGGKVRIGGDYLGQGAIPNAQRTYVSPNAVINADQGRVIVWSDAVTRFFGTVNAAGGFVETSSKDYLEVAGAAVQADHWLLDPRNVTLTNATVGGTFAAGTFTPTADNATVDVATIVANLNAGTNVTITTGATGTQDGNITVASAIAPNNLIAGTATLTLDAANNIVVNAAITNADPVDTHFLDVALDAGNNVDVNANITTGGGRIEINAGGNIDTTGFQLDSSDTITSATANALGGDIILNAGGTIAAGPLNASATGNSPSGNNAIGGDVTLTAGGSIATNMIDVSATALIAGFSATNGTITINANQTPTTQNTTTTPPPDDTNPDSRVVDETTQNCLGPGCPDRAAIEEDRDRFLRGDYPMDVVYCRGETTRAVASVEDRYSQAFASYLKLDRVPPIVTSTQAKTVLRNVAQTTGQNTAVVYMGFCPQTAAGSLQTEIEQRNFKQTPPEPTGSVNLNRDTDRLVLLLVHPGQDPIRHELEVSREEVRRVGRRFSRTVANPSRRDAYLDPAQTLYSWLLAPMEAELQAAGIDHIAYVPVPGLRTVPLAALHDGTDFAIARYSLSVLPSLSLTSSRPGDLRQETVLAMGAETFREHPDLPAVPVEVKAIAQTLWSGEAHLNEAFTHARLKNAHQNQGHGIIHLATHGFFKPGAVDASYLQLWDRQLSLTDIQQLDWQSPLVELLVLSACETALGDLEAELGFTGLAVSTGAKSAIGSLWIVSDLGTVGLMTQFYEKLQTHDRAIALQQAQLAMSRSQVRVEGNQLLLSENAIAIPPGLRKFAPQDFSHPFYWAAFTLVGSPW